ncbi:hypothetical protein GCM10011414_18840 [Croceivirga lutea]|uniref:sensor histidine kinase n=1 Tax=Croceivirga lutea TaxID=1775167 RepID=UPI00163AAF2E|nr:sensor histidine kinase [Croceivirga lutea]GGG49248.1 hypothetical protein GCM10011414_18840 [Croceivirga lutea]
MKNPNWDSEKLATRNQLVEIINYFASAVTMALVPYGWARELHIVVLSVIFILSLIFLFNGLYVRKKASYKFTESDIDTKLEEKEMLIKEVHHRVKNNLQTVSSLLSLQSRTFSDPKIEAIIKSSQHRVVSMSMVHEMLYKRDEYNSTIAVKSYIKELCEYLVRSIKGNENNITLKLDLGDYKLSVDTVIPLGLIINETITNALKYGIPSDNNGELTILLTKKGTDNYEMYLGDDGVGFPEDLDPKTTNSLGLKLIHNLARQLKGTIVRDLKANGTYYQINFEEINQEFKTII